MKNVKRPASMTEIEPRQRHTVTRQPVTGSYPVCPAGRAPVFRAGRFGKYPLVPTSHTGATSFFSCQNKNARDLPAPTSTA
jgi:hypothetical protein